MSMKIYCCKPISGRSADEVFEYYERMSNTLSEWGYSVLSPLHGKNLLRTETEFRAQGVGLWCRS